MSDTKMERRSPPLESFANTPKDKQADGGPGGIEQYIQDRGLPVRHKKLMQFIARRIECHQQYRQPGLAATPGTRLMPQRLAQGPPKEQAQNGVLGHMRAFTHREHDPIDRLIGKMRKKPAENWFDNTRGMLERFRIARSRIDYHHPNQRWQPIDHERPYLLHRP